MLWCTEVPISTFCSWGTQRCEETELLARNHTNVYGKCASVLNLRLRPCLAIGLFSSFATCFCSCLQFQVLLGTETGHNRSTFKVNSRKAIVFVIAVNTCLFLFSSLNHLFHRNRQHWDSCALLTGKWRTKHTWGNKLFVI